MVDLPLLTIHTDGASRGNPGAAAFAYVIEQDGQPPLEEAGCLGQMTNNQAEYTALVRALERALQLGAGHRVLLHSDSELMVKQMAGEYRVKNGELRDLYQQAQELRRQMKGGVILRHVRREHNSRADALCNAALDGRLEDSPRALAIPRTPKAAPAAASLRQQAIACLQQAAAAWQAGAATPTPEKVWQQLEGSCASTTSS
jgi:ribonuclease HI